MLLLAGMVNGCAQDVDLFRCKSREGRKIASRPSKFFSELHKPFGRQVAHVRRTRKGYLARPYTRPASGTTGQRGQGCPSFLLPQSVKW